MKEIDCWCCGFQLILIEGVRGFYNEGSGFSDWNNIIRLVNHFMYGEIIIEVVV